LYPLYTLQQPSWPQRNIRLNRYFKLVFRL
jgi:hypothetical protein